jgi:hypothetical protein
MKNWLMIAFTLAIMIWAMVGFVTHDEDCLCPQCEIAYDVQWERDHEEELR